MATPPVLQNSAELFAAFVRNVVAYTSQITWFGSNGVIAAFGRAVVAMADHAQQLYTSIVRRYTLSGAQGQYLDEVAIEHGTERAPGVRARLLLVIRPETANVSNVRAVGADDYIEVDDSSGFAAAMSVRIRDQAGTLTEVFTVASISAGTGPGGDDELVVTGGLANVYPFATEDVDVLARIIVPAGTEATSSAGITFTLLEAVATSDANPVLDGEGSALALLDKGWAEATQVGASGNIEASTITGLVAPIAGVREVVNPEPGIGGADEESDIDLRYRAAHRATLANQEAAVWYEATAKEGNADVLRAVRDGTFGGSSINLLVLKRSGAPFTAAELTALEEYMEARVRSGLGVTLANVVPTSVEVSARITLDPDTTLEAVYRAAAALLAQYLDYRRWASGTPVDEAQLLSIVVQTPGVASLETSSFLPAADVTVSATSFPTLATLSLEDITSGLTINADLTMAF